MSSSRIEISKEAIELFCRRWKVTEFALFGSALRNDLGPDSDVDVLVEFEPEQPIGLMEVVGIEIELSEMMGRKVDLRTPEDLSKYFRDKVVAGAEVQYQRV